jgi:hypothetical protein
VFETVHTAKTTSPASSVWAKWAKPARWSEWDARVQGAETDGELTEGAQVKVKLRKGGTVRQRVAELEPGRRLVTEYAIPGARVGHEHVVEQRGPSAEITHRLYVEGPLSGMWALMLGRKKMRDAAAGFTDG